MRRRIASYYRKGFMSSRRARAAVARNEHPLSYWKERFYMDDQQIDKLLIYMGNHHVGVNCNLVPFYRLPDKNNLNELMNIRKEFNMVPAKKVNFIRILADHLQHNITDKRKTIPRTERPGKRRRRRAGGNRKKRRRNGILTRQTFSEIP